MVGLVCAQHLAHTSHTHALSTNAIHNYFWANYQLFNNNAVEAQRWYNKLLTSNPPIYFYRGYVSFLFGVKAYAEIVKLIPKLDTHYHDDVDLQLIFAQALMGVGNTQASNDLFIRLSNQFKTNQAAVFQAAQIYMSKKEPENAIAVIDSLLNSSPKKSNNFIFHFLKAQIYVQQQDNTKALSAVTACLEMHRHFDKGWLLFALLQEQKGELTDAIAGYTNFLETSAVKDPSIQQHLVQLAFKQKMEQQNKKTGVTEQSCFALALSSFESKHYLPALEHINHCLDKTPADPQARLLKIQILTALNAPAQAADTIKPWIYENPDAQTWYQSLHLLCAAGLTHHKAIAILEDIAHKHPNALRPYLYLADLNTRIGNTETALSHHQRALTATDDSALKTKILFHMGYLYTIQNKADLAQKTLEEGRALGHNFPPLLNLLAYHYATQKKNLSKAEQLINQALAASTNPHFLDTKALVLYKQKKYNHALRILQTIETQAPHDFTILKHLAKTYYRLGNKVKALETITNAKQYAHYDHEKNKADFMINQWKTKKA
jgi:predicted Zn-dependent protease